MKKMFGIDVETVRNYREYYKSICKGFLSGFLLVAGIILGGTKILEIGINKFGKFDLSEFLKEGDE